MLVFASLHFSFIMSAKPMLAKPTLASLDEVSADVPCWSHCYQEKERALNDWTEHGKLLMHCWNPWSLQMNSVHAEKLWWNVSFPLTVDQHSLSVPAVLLTVIITDHFITEKSGRCRSMIFIWNLSSF